MINFPRYVRDHGVWLTLAACLVYVLGNRPAHLVKLRFAARRRHLRCQLKKTAGAIAWTGFEKQWQPVKVVGIDRTGRNVIYSFGEKRGAAQPLFKDGLCILSGWVTCGKPVLPAPLP